MGTGTLAVGTGNVDGAIFAMGMSEMLIKLHAIIQSLLVTAGTLLLKHGQLIIQIFTRLLIRHTPFPPFSLF